MKIFGKCIILALIAIFAVSAFSACTPTVQPSTEPATTEPAAFNLYGADFKIAQFSSNTLGDNNPLLYVDKTLVADLALARLKEIGERYNCTITIDYYNKDDGSVGLFISAATIFPAKADLIFSGNADVSTALCKGQALLPILDYNDILGYDSSTFDLYGKPCKLESCMYNGVLYYLTPNAHPLRTGGGEFFAVNTSIIKEYNNDFDVRESVEQNTWTWSTFEEILSKTTMVENGAVKLKGAGSTGSDFTEYALLSNGFSRSRKTSDGKFVANYDTENARQALEWVRSIQNNFSDNVIFESRAQLLNDYEAGDIAMIFMTAEYLRTKVSFINHEFAVVPFPAGPMGNLQTNYISGGGSGFAIYRPTENPEAAAQVIHDYCQPFAEYPDEQSLIDYLKNTFWDERDIKVMLDADGRRQFSYYNYDGNVIATSFFNGTMTAQECISKYAPLMDRCLEEWILPNQALIDRLTNQ